MIESIVIFMIAGWLTTFYLMKALIEELEEDVAVLNEKVNALQAPERDSDVRMYGIVPNIKERETELAQRGMFELGED